MKHYKANILNLFNRCTPDEVRANRGWYNEAHQFAQRIAEKYSMETFVVAGIIAAISPAVNWEQNKVDAEAFISTFKRTSNVPNGICTTYRNNVLKALKIAKTDVSNRDLAIKTIYSILLGKQKQGNKTASFFMNIAFPEYPAHVTIDRHSYRVAMGGEGERGAIRVNIKAYREISNAYLKASKQTTLTAVELQAVTWCKYKNELTKEVPF